MREWRLRLDKQGVDKWRYEELKAICRQYPQMMRSKDAGARARKQLIDQAARDTDGGRWEVAIIKNVCHGRRYEHLAAEDLWSSSRNAYFAARREFFARLDAALREHGD